MDIKEVKQFITESTMGSAVYVGCDSHKTTKRGKRETVFVTVVVIHKDCSSGAKVFSRTDVLPEFPSNRVRLLKEVEMAVDIAYEIADTVGKRVFEVHLDLNPSPEHYSNCVVKEAIGWVKGMGYTPVIKPDSVAANACADGLAVKAAGK